MPQIRYDGHDTSRLSATLAFVLEHLSVLAETPEAKGFYGSHPMHDLPGAGYRTRAAQRLAESLRTIGNYPAEVCLSGPGLKLSAQWERQSAGHHVLAVRIGSDQWLDYPYFVRVACELLSAEGLMTDAERERIQGYMRKNGRERQPRSVPVHPAAPLKPARQAERPFRLTISFNGNHDGWHYVLHKRRDGSVIPQVIDGRQLPGEPFRPDAPVQEVVSRALALATQHRIAHIEVSDPANATGQRKLLTTEDCKTLPLKTLGMMVCGLAGR